MKTEHVLLAIAIGGFALKVVSLLLELKCPECGKKVRCIEGELYFCDNCKSYIYKNDL